MGTPQIVILESDQMKLSTNGVAIAPIGLRNTEATPIRIDKLTFNTTTASSAVRVQLRLRNAPLTNGFVPIGVICYQQNEGQEDNNLSNGNGVSVWAAPLRRPIYLQPGDIINVSTWNYGGSVGGGFLGAIGSQVDSVPDERYLPFFAAVDNPVRKFSGAQNVFDTISSPNELCNPFDVPLIVERLVGRFLDEGTAVEDITQALSINLRISDDHDRLWTDNFQAMTSIFDQVTRSWPINHVMDPGDYLRVECDNVANTLADFTTACENAATASNPQVIVGFIACRRAVY